MRLTTDECLAALDHHSAGFASAARGNLDAAVRHCPGWTVADLVWHLTQVHWFWGTIAAERLAAPPDDSRRPVRGPEEELVDTFETGARRLVHVLGEADQDAAVWTWAPQRDVAFITRHQVQEAAVHHWDAAEAAGVPVSIAPAVAADAVAEFLTVSLGTEDDPATSADGDPPPARLEGRFALRATDLDASWTISDAETPGALRVRPGAAPDDPGLDAPAADLLLWLYGRVRLDTATVGPEVVTRFRDLCFTD